MLSGPIFTPKAHGVWESIFHKDGGHYNIFSCGRDEAELGMQGLRECFPEGKADEFNLVLFSTSGVHGSYMLIEEAQRRLKNKKDNETHITFLVVQPRVVTLYYGNCIPKTQDDIDFLKRLRESSWQEFLKIGRKDHAPQTI